MAGADPKLNMIPKRIIQTARSDALQPTALGCATNIKLLHAGWEYRFFNDAAVRGFVQEEFPEYQTTFDSFRFNIQRIDFFRYLAVYRLGGFYFDLDVLLNRSLAPLLDSAAVFPFEELTLSTFLRRRYQMDWEIGNYAFGAEAGDPFLRAVIENCCRSINEPVWMRPMMQGVPRLFYDDLYVLNTTGPGMLSRTLAENPALAPRLTMLFPDDVCDANSWHLFGEYGIHMMEGSWRSKGGFIKRRLARLWESRLRRRQLVESRAYGPTRSLPRTLKSTDPLSNATR